VPTRTSAHVSRMSSPAWPHSACQTRDSPTLFLAYHRYLTELFSNCHTPRDLLFKVRLAVPSSTTSRMSTGSLHMHDSITAAQICTLYRESFCIMITHRATHRLLCHHPTTVLSRSHCSLLSKWAPRGQVFQPRRTSDGMRHPNCRRF
jgi:hypothetical protein